MSGEKSGERWTPVQRVESVLLSIISLLDDAECSSPANVDAGVMLRKDPAQYRQLVKADVEASKKDIPPGFHMPSGVEKPAPVEKHDDSDFWCESDQENDFDDDCGGSDTDEAMTQDEAEDEDEDDEEDEEMGESYDVHEEEEEL